MATNDFLPFATGVGANVLTQSAYAAASARTAGQQPGVASSALNNKAVRQAAYIASCLAQYLANTTGDNIADDGVQSEVLATMAKAFANPAGAITMFGGAAAPSGFLLCDGSAVSRTTYSNLYSAIGTAYGVGDGSTTFNVPDMRGMFARGVTGASANDPDASSRTATNGGNTGNNVGSVQTDQVGPHTHTFAMLPSPGAAITPSTGSGATAGTFTTNSNGTTETRPKNVYVNFIIKI